MADHILLLGAEGVERAGHNMASAADEMRRASSNFEESLHRHRLFMDEWLMRLQSIMEAKNEE